MVDLGSLFWDDFNPIGTVMAKSKKHKWAFRARFRTGAYGWRGTKIAKQRLREAVSEIKKVRRKDPVLAAEGAVQLIERLWPALEHIDSSSGAIGTAVNRTMDELVPIIIEAPANRKSRDGWLESLWEAYEEDGVDYTYEVADRWGELCGSSEAASEWADRLLPPLKITWAPDRKKGSYYRGTPACLSSMLAAGRYQELLDLLDKAPYVIWFNRKFGVKALVALGRSDEAIQYAKKSHGLNDPVELVMEACEEILISMGRVEEAYEKFSTGANIGMSNLATFRKIAKKYPDKSKEEILNDLIERTAEYARGGWFATAKELGLYDVAAELVKDSPCDPMTLSRAAKKYLDSNPGFARDVAISSLKWMAQGEWYKLGHRDVVNAYRSAIKAAEALSNVDETKERIRSITTKTHADCQWVKAALEAALKMEQIPAYFDLEDG